jgi:hypothetical protein
MWCDTKFGNKLFEYYKDVKESWNGEMVDVLSGPDLYPTSHPWQIVEMTDQAAKSVLDEIIKYKVRGVMVLSTEPFARLFICQMVKHGVKQMTLAHFGWYYDGWQADNQEGASCTEEEMNMVAEYFLSASSPSFGADAQLVPCDATGSFTVGDFRTEYEDRVQALGANALPNAGRVADSVCMMAILFNDMIDAGFSLEDLRSWNQTTFLAAVAKMQATDFDGISGRVQFPLDGAQYGGGDRLGQNDLFQNANGAYRKIGSATEQADGSMLISLSPGQQILFSDGAGGFVTVPPGMFYPTCPTGQVYDHLSQQCLACPPNHTYVPAVDSCLCSVGYYSDGSSGGVASICLPCAAGEYSSGSGALQCMACPSGHFAPMPGSIECEPCPVGSYASMEGETACTACGPKKTTLQSVSVSGQTKWVLLEAADNETSCGCEEGTHGTTECFDCTEGLLCGGRDDITVLEGYSSEAELSVFKCHGNPLRCKGGILGQTCAAGRTGISCAQCEDDMKAASDGTCVPCDGPDLASLFVVATLIVMVLCAVYRMVGKDIARQNHAVMLSFMTLGLLVTLVQQFGVIALFSLDWPEPMRSLMEIMQLFTFDVGVLNVSCVASVSALSQFTATVAIPYVCGGTVVALHCLSVLLQHGGRFSSRMHMLTASIGVLFLAFYISVLVNTLSPFQCQSNPNGISTLSGYQSIVCWTSDEHMAMILVGVVGSLGPLLLAAKFSHVVLRFPAEVSKGNSEFLRSYLFLFLRYRPETYLYVLVHIARSTFFALVPLVPHVTVQILLAQSITLLSLVFVIYFIPWRVWHVNLLEGFFTASISMIILLSAFFVDFVTTKPIAYFAATLTFGLFFISLIVVVFGLCTHLRQRRQKPFGFFLCHHKAGAGSFARLLKMSLVQVPRMRKKVFYDCDDLTELNVLFDIVGNQIDELVVLCSKDIMTRPWCVGEICTARASNVRVIRVIFPDFLQPDSESIDKIASRMPDFKILAQYGITLESIQDTLLCFKENPSINLPAQLSQKTMDALTNELVSDVRHQTIDIEIQEEDIVPQGVKTVVVVDHSDCEALANATVMVRELFKYFIDAPDEVPFILPQNEALPTTTETVLLSCTNGVLQEPAALKALMASQQLDARHLLILGSGDFRFPTQRYFKEEYHRSAIVAVTDTPDVLEQFILDLFLSIAIPFQSQTSTELTLHTKAQEIANRIRTDMAPRLSSCSSFSGSNAVAGKPLVENQQPEQMIAA